MAEFRRTNPDQRDDAVVSSQQVSWWSVHEHVAALLERVGSWPTAGTPAWCALDDDDPVKLAALCDAARQHVLRVEVAQEQLAEASRDVSAAEDWCARERATAAPRGLHPAGDRVMTTTAYGTSALNGQRYRRTKAELAEIDAAIYNIAEAEKPVTVRGLFYRVMSRGLVPKTEQGYSVVQRQALKMRRRGELPYGCFTDGSRLRLKPRTFSSAQAALENTARMYRRDLWINQGVHVEVWTEKDAIRGVVTPVTAEYDVPLMISRGFSSETFLYETAEEINDEGNPAVIYPLGDRDPSGVAAWDDIQRKLRDFVS